MPTSKFKQLAASMAVRLLRAVRWIKRGAQTVLRWVGRGLAPVWRLFVRIVILPIYGLIMTIRLRINRLALPARGFVLFLITNKYLLHGVVLCLTAVVVLGNVQAQQAHAQDVGQKSLLFAMATDQPTEIVEESARPETLVPNSNYLGSATVQGIPHVDFDYTQNVEPILPSLSVPGTIAAQPVETAPETSRAPRTKIETYVVQENDTIGSIANRFNVNVGTILWNNNLTERQYIRPGDTLTIPPVSGMIVTVKKGDTLNSLANKYGGDADEISSFNNINGGQLAVGTELVIPGGQPPAPVQTQTQIAARQPTPSSPAQPPTHVTIGADGIPRNPITFNPAPKPPDVIADIAANHLLWPTSGHTITQYYGWQHTGVDIDGDYTSPIYAAADGVVETAGWNSGGYGLMIMIDHPQLGMKTRYGHSSKIFVQAGDQVKKGQVIAMVGTTGRSTGTHLHFEVYVNGKRTNPLGYIKPTAVTTAPEPTGSGGTDSGSGSD